MKKYTLITLIVLPLVIFAQVGKKVNQEGVLKTPTYFANNLKYQEAHRIYAGQIPIEQFFYSKESEGVFENIPWCVYSDRDSNKLYESASNSSPTGEVLKMGQRVYVTKMSSSWLEVAKKTKKDEYKIIGWINVENTLINGKCVLAEGVNLQKRGLILFDYMQLKDMSSEEKKRVLDASAVENFYSDPMHKNINGRTAKYLEIRYVYKETNESVLLGGTYTFADVEGVNNFQDLNGWIQKPKVTPWDSRLCLEPISEQLQPMSYDNYQNEVMCNDVNEDTIHVFYDLHNRLQTYKSQTGCNKLGWIQNMHEDGEITYSEPIVENRWGGFKMRYPVLKVHNYGEDREIAIVSTLNQSESSEDVDVEELREKIRKIEDKLTKVNILLVLDATQSMSDYRDYLINAIENIVNELEAAEQFSDKEVQIAIGVYRNKNDKGKPYKRMEYTGLTPLSKLRKIKSVLNSLEFGSSEKGTHFEDMYYGIIQSINKTFDKDTEGESNIMVLVGDCGANEYGKYTQQAVIDKIIDNKISLINYQCNYVKKKETGVGKNPWQAYSSDQTRFMIEIGNAFYGKNGEDFTIGAYFSNNASRLNNLARFVDK